MKTKLIINPLLSIRTFAKNSDVSNLQTAAPKKGDSVRIHSFFEKKDPVLFAKVKNVVLEKNYTEINSFLEDETTLLKKMNILIEKNDISDYPKFSCRLDETTKTTTGNLDSSEWEINRSVLIAPISAPHNEVARRIRNSKFHLAFDDSHSEVLWVKEYITGGWWPYQLDDKLMSIVKGLLSSKIEVSMLTKQNLALFVEIGFFMPKNSEEKRNEHILDAQETFRTKNSICLKQVVNPHIRIALKNYLEKLQQEGFLRLGDFQTFNRYWAHNETVNRYVQSQVYEYLSEVVNKNWVPAFSYYVSYQDGSSLKTHLDRSQASLTLSLLIEYGDSENYLEDEWPIYVEKTMGCDTYHKYVIGKGNAGLFCGNEFVHYRLPIPKGHYSMSMLFHFVPEEFEGKYL